MFRAPPLSLICSCAFMYDWLSRRTRASSATLASCAADALGLGLARGGLVLADLPGLA